MKIAFVGKGGSGKTTLAGLFVRMRQEAGYLVLAIDADLNQHLGRAVGIPEDCIPPPLGEHLPTLKSYLRGTNARIQDPAHMIKTTPPGTGSTLLGPHASHPLWETHAYTNSDIRFLRAGTITDSDVGTRCYHAKTGAVELLLSHLIDRPEEFVVVDMTAGADAFASGLFAQFDMTYIVVEPTLRSLEVFRQYQSHAQEYGVPVCAVGNKAMGQDDRDFLLTELGDALQEIIPLSPYVRSMERGETPSLHTLDTPTREALSRLIAHAETSPIDRIRTRAHHIHFHIKNAESWGNADIGIDLTAQIDPTFEYPTA